MPAGDARISFVGTVGQDPEIRDVGGSQVASFSVAVSSRKREGDQWVDGPTTWHRCSAWRELAPNVAATLTKGMRVVVEGTIAERKYQDREGNERSAWEVTVEEVGPSLRFATAQVERTGGQRGGQRPPAGNGDMTGRSGPQGQPRQQQRQQYQQPQQSRGGYDDETPF